MPKLIFLQHALKQSEIMTKIRVPKGFHGLNKYRIALVPFYIVSVILVAEMAYCLVYPSNVSADKLNIDQRARLNVDNLSLSPAVRNQVLSSSVQFLDYPVNSKQLFEVDLSAPEDIHLHWLIELRITGNDSEPFEFLGGKIGPYDLVNSFQMLINAQNVNCDYSYVDGKIFYSIPAFSLTKADGLKTIEINMDISRPVNSSNLVKRSWIFNDNYGQYVNFILLPVPLETNSTSDVNSFNVAFTLPFQTVLPEQSGWAEMYAIPISEGSSRIQLFEYPINQEIEHYGNTYAFKTNFSQQNQANIVQVVFVPNSGFSVLVAILLLAPYYIPALFWVDTKLDERSVRNGPSLRSKSVSTSVLWMARKIFLLFTGPVFSLIVGLILNGVNLLQFLSFTIQIMAGGLFGFALVTLFPIAFSILFYAGSRKNKASNAHSDFEINESYEQW
jgi:hypothetical protein